MIYFAFAREAGLVKIGYSRNAIHRLRSPTFCPYPLVLLGTLPGGREVEAACHAQYSTFRLSSRKEWFRADASVIQSIGFLLAREGSPGTVGQELARRDGCRYGLRGVLVSLKGDPTSYYKVASSYWGRDEKLRLKLHPFSPDVSEEAPQTGWVFRNIFDPLPEEPFGTLRNVDSDDCFLLSDWPVVCTCWMENNHAG